MGKDNFENISEEDEFANAYYYFLEALTVLSGDIDTQCKTMGNFNVAWELKDDISRGAYLLDMPKGKLSENEKKGIAELMKAINEIPNSVLIAVDTEEGNKKAMKNPCWESLRKEAKKLLQVLKPI